MITPLFAEWSLPKEPFTYEYMAPTDVRTSIANNTCRACKGVRAQTAMAYRRKDKSPKTWFRSSRVFRSDGQWYFHTREGIVLGPYHAQFEAEVDAERLKSLLVDVDGDSAKDIIQAFMVDSRASFGDLTGAAYTDYLLDDEVEPFRTKLA